MIHEKAPAVRVEVAKVKDLSLKKAVIDKALKIEADLIILSRNYYAIGLPYFNRSLPMQLAKEAPCAVLTVASKAAYSAIKTVIVPLTRDATYNKMGVLAALSGNKKLDIHLVTFKDHRDNLAKNAPSSLLRIYQWIKTSLQCQVQCKSLSGRHIAEATLNYARSVNADVILIDPDVQLETFWPGRNIISFLQSKSEIPVLAVQPMGPLISH
jgi:hypothetical protein